MITRYFLQHPASVGENYSQHLLSAWRFAGLLLMAAASCLLHGLLPFLCTRTGSSLIQRLHQQMVINRHASAETKKDQYEAQRQAT